MARVSAVLDSASVTTNASASATITVKAHLKNGSSSSGWGAGLKVYIDGELVKTVTGYSNTEGGRFASVTATKKITKTTASQRVTCKITAYSTTVDGMGGCGDSNIDPKTISKSVTVDALASYTVAYDANGGSGAPSSQKKYYGKTLTLSSTKPTKSGYTFKGWATSASGSVAYSAGGSYTENSAATLYAVWAADTVYVSFDANGGSGAPAKISASSGTAITIPTAEPIRTNYRFLGWATSSTAASAAYTAGSSYTPTADVTLYAVWEYSVTPPTINVVTNVCRTATADYSDTTPVETGAYLCCFVNYSYLDPSVSGSTKHLYFTIKKADGTSVYSSYISYSTSASTGNLLFKYATALDSNTAYVVEFYIKDVDYNTTSNIVAARFPKNLITFQVARGGGGIGIGRTAPDNGFAVGFNASFTEPVSMGSSLDVSGNVNVGGHLTGGTYKTVIPYSSNFTTYSNDALARASNVQLRRCGNVVHVTGEASPASAIAGSADEILMFTIPDGLRPTDRIIQVCQGSTYRIWTLMIYPDGTATFSRYRINLDTTTVTRYTATKSGGPANKSTNIVTGVSQAYVNASTTAWLPFSVTYIID